MLKLARQERSIIHAFLEKANVPFTDLGLRQTIKAHPEAGSLLAIGDILDDYNIENISVRVHGDELNKIGTPFISQLEKPKREFVLVTNVDINGVEYVNRHHALGRLPLSEFKEKWGGIALMTEVTDNSREKDYRANRIKNVLFNLRVPFVTAVFFLLTLYWGIYRHLPIRDGYYVVLFSLFFTGVIITTLLVIQAIGKENSLVHRICSAGKFTHCNNILESPAAKLRGLVGWSDIGWVYFLGNLLSLLTIRDALPVLQLINVCALPYTFWSIYYQWKIGKQWCPFCLAVQAILWLTFIVSTLYLNGMDFRGMTVDSCVATGSLFLLPATLAWFIFPFINQAVKTAPLQRELQRIRTSEAFFNATLDGMERVSFEEHGPGIVFGNDQAPFEMTVVSNPYCAPCSRIHKRVMELLSKFPNQLKLRYVFAVAPEGDEQRNYAIRYLIAASRQYGWEDTERIYAAWYQSQNMNELCKKFPVEPDDVEINAIMRAHKDWCKRAGIEETPTIYLNGRRFPEGYEVEDLKYFIRA